MYLYFYRSFQSSWFEKFKWLEYSISSDKCFCYACRFFGLGQTTDAFTKTGFSDWKHAFGKIKFIGHNYYNNIQVKRLVVKKVVLLPHTIPVHHTKEQLYHGRHILIPKNVALYFNSYQQAIIKWFHSIGIT